MVRYQVKLYDDSGNLLHVIRESELNYLSMAVAENEIGELVFTMPQGYIDFAMVEYPDKILTVERDVGQGFAVECGQGAEQGFLLRDVEFETDQSYNKTVSLYAYSGNYLLDGRIVAARSSDDDGEYTDQCEDMGLYVARMNMTGLAADSSRALSRFSVADGNGDAPTTTKTIAHANIWNVLRDLADESWESGTYLVFDTVYLHPGKFELRAYLGQRGVNMGMTARDKRIVRPHPCKLRLARKDERNYIYAGGQGKGQAQTIKTATLEKWTAASIWNRRELWVSAAHTDTDDAIQSAANAALYNNRPRWILEGDLADVDGQRYGIDYHYGDVLVAQYNDVVKDVHVAAVNLVYSAGRETVTARVRSEP